MKLDEIIYRVRPHVEGCPEPVIVDELRLATEELCRQSYIWEQELTPVSVVRDQASYTLPFPSGTRIVSPQRARIGDNWLEYNHTGDLERVLGRDWRSKRANPHYWFMEGPYTIRLVPIPQTDNANSLVAWATIEPAEVDVELPDWFRQYDRCLAEGALATLKEIPGKDWTDPQMAQIHRRRFGTDVADIRYDASRNFSDRPVRTRAYHR